MNSFNVGYKASAYLIQHAIGKQGKVINWLMLHCIPNHNNAIRTTYTKLAKDTSTSRGTVHSAIRILEARNYIKHANNIWYLSPDLAMKGNTNKYRQLKYQYDNL